MDGKKARKVSKQDRKKFILLIVVLVLLLAATAVLMPYFVKLAEEENREQLISWVQSKGIWGVLILLGLQMLQVVVAFIPGEVVEVVSGILYGTVGGYLICTVGVILSSVLVFYTVRRLGSGFVSSIVTPEKMQKMKFLQNTQKLEMMVFILFFIPGTPKDMLTYIVPLTEIKASRFFLWSTVARIPSVVSSTYAGASIGDGDWIKTILIFVVTGAVGVLGIVFHDRIIRFFHRPKGNGTV